MVRSMQPPTCSGLRVRSIADCNVIFHAVTLGILPLISRRLTIEERRAIQSGCVFVWEERTPTIEVVGVSTNSSQRFALPTAHACHSSGRAGTMDGFEAMGGQPSSKGLSTPSPVCSACSLIHLFCRTFSSIKKSYPMSAIHACALLCTFAISTA